MQLVIGTKTWSSWSMRPWLALKQAGVAFDEQVIALRRHETSDAVAKASPSGRVPVLYDGELTVWDSLAICEYVADRRPEAGLWPQDPAARAVARSAVAEMHSGFASLRGECPMDLRMHARVATLSEMTHHDIRRLVQLWTELRERWGGAGAFLFGPWSIADAFFTPVATRFRSYGVRLTDFGDRGAAGAYAEALLEHPAFRQWGEEAARETLA